MPTYTPTLLAFHVPHSTIAPIGITIVTNGINIIIDGIEGLG